MRLPVYCASRMPLLIESLAEDRSLSSILKFRVKSAPCRNYSKARRRLFSAYGISGASRTRSRRHSSREGATLLLTYQNERAKPTVEELGNELGATGFFPCDVQQQSDIDNLAAAVKAQGHRLDAVVHCLAFANHEDLGNPFVNTSRDGFQLALDVSAFSLVAVSKALAAADD